MADETYRGLLENISETSGTYKQMLQAIAEGGGGGWDAVIRLTHTNDSSDDTTSTLTPSIISGTHADLLAKLSNGEYPTILVEYNHPYGIRFAVPMAYICSFSSSLIEIYIAGYSIMGGRTFKTFGLLDWTSNDTISWQ